MKETLKDPPAKRKSVNDEDCISTPDPALYVVGSDFVNATYSSHVLLSDIPSVGEIPHLCYPA